MTNSHRAENKQAKIVVSNARADPDDSDGGKRKISENQWTCVPSENSN